MNTQKKEIQKKMKSQKESVPVSPALYHGIFMLKSNVDTPIELDEGDNSRVTRRNPGE
jgi:hypothetical protein